MYDSELNEISFNDDNDICPEYSSYLSENLSAGTYYLVCEGYETDCGEYVLTLSAIHDDESPIPDLLVLDDLIGDCFVDFPVIPTATDICAGSIEGYTDTDFPIYGSTVITWNYDDGGGHIVTQTQNVIIADSQAPIPDINGFRIQIIANNSEVDEILWRIEDASSTIVASGGPYSTAIPGDVLEIVNNIPSENGPYTVYGTTAGVSNDNAFYFELYCNETFTTFGVFNPGETLSFSGIEGCQYSLFELTDECFVIPPEPTATDECMGTIYGTTSTVLPVTAPGTTVITWTFEDGNGNISTQTQNVVISDVTAPIPTYTELTDLSGCESFPTLTIPTATDYCSGTIEGVHDATLPITESTTITWTYDDGKGNISTQTQDVIIGVDEQAPFPIADFLEQVFGCNSIDEIESPTAIDACAGTIIGTTDATFPILETTIVIWQFDDGNGNISTQEQSVLVTNIDNSVTVNSPVLTANMSADNYQWIDCDNENTPIDGENNQSFTATVSGNYAVMIYDSECMSISDCIFVTTTSLETPLSSEIIVCPNPTESILNIKLSNSSSANWKIASITGQIIKEGTTNEQLFQIDMADYASGVYMLYVQQNNSNVVKRIVRK